MRTAALTAGTLIAGILLALALIAIASPGGIGRMLGQVEEDASPAQIAALAARVRPGEVTLYTADGGLYCKLATEWLTQRRFAYTECNISASGACARAFKAYGARGTPFLVVRGEQMREGFQPGVFLKILNQRPG